MAAVHELIQQRREEGFRVWIGGTVSEDRELEPYGKRLRFVCDVVCVCIRGG